MCTGDGRPDLLVTALKGETFPLYVNDGAMTFHDGTHQARLAGPSAQRSGWGVSLVDLDNDGRPDIVTANSHVNDRIEQFEASSYKEPNTMSDQSRQWLRGGHGTGRRGVRPRRPQRTVG